MQPTQKLNAAVLGVILATTFLARAENTSLQQKLESKYALTSINAEGGVVIQGATLTLRKDGLTAGATYACASDYKNGKFAPASKICTASRTVDKLRGIPWLGSHIPNAPQGTTVVTRPFNRGEKFYITSIAAADGITFSLISDAIDNVTYKAEIRFKAQDLAQADRLVAEVFSVTPPDSQQQSAQPVAPAVSTAAAAQNWSPDPPPPPPVQEATPARPAKTVSMGMPIEQVVEILGQPAQILDGGAKKIYLYKDLKLTFVDGKVSDCQ